MARRLIPIAFLLGCAGAAFAAEPVPQGVVQAGPPLAEAPGAAPLRPARSLSPDEQSGAVLPAVAAMALRGADAGPVSAMPGLRGALDDALTRDPYSRAAFADVKAADREVWRELLRYAPTVYGTLNFNRTETAAPARIGTERDSYATIEAAWKVLDGGTTYYAVKAARARRDAAVHDAMTERGRTTLKVIDAWTGAIANGRELAVAQAAVGRLRKLRAAVSARRDAGFAAASDVAQVDADIAAARRTVASLEAAAEKSRASANRLAGRTPEEGAGLPDFSAALGGGREALIDGAHRANPQLKAASSRYYSEIYAARSAFGRHLPSVELTAQYRIGYDQPAETAANSDSLTVGARLRVPIVDLATVADTAAQSARVEAALYREAATLQDVETQIDNLFTDWRAAGAMRKEAETEAAMRRKSAGAARQRFENGFGSLEEAIRAEAALATAERAALQMQAQESLTAAQLLVISGRFRPELMD